MLAGKRVEREGGRREQGCEQVERFILNRSKDAILEQVAREYAELRLRDVESGRIDIGAYRGYLFSEKLDPSSPNRLRLRFRSSRFPKAPLEMAPANDAIPSSPPILFSSRLRCVRLCNAPLEMASANAFIPSGPIELPLRLRFVRVVVLWPRLEMALVNAFICSTFNLLFLMSRSSRCFKTPLDRTSANTCMPSRPLNTWLQLRSSAYAREEEDMREREGWVSEMGGRGQRATSSTDV